MKSLLFVLIVRSLVSAEFMTSINPPKTPGSVTPGERAQPPHSNFPNAPPMPPHVKRQSGTCGAASLLTPAQKQETVNVHNSRRAQEPASNMLALTYNENLANMAQNLTNTCVFAHAMLTGCDGNRMGQNIYIYAKWIPGNVTAYPPVPSNMTDAILAWNSEKAYYTYSTASCAPNQMCGHYTQNVWATTTQVGCGYTNCPVATMPGSSPLYNAILVACNYSPGGNVILASGTAQQPYLTGTACSNCDSQKTGAGYKCVESLCVPCSPSNDPACRCGTQPTCQNGGVWNSATCSCQCTSLAYGTFCENLCSCADQVNYCSSFTSYCNDPSYSAYMTQNCLKTCGFACTRPASCTAG